MKARKLIDNVKKELNIEHDKELAELAGIKIGTLTQAIARNSFQFETLIPFLLSRGVNLNRIFEGESAVQIINGDIRGGQNAQNVEGNQSQSGSPTKYEIDEALLKLIQNAVVMVDADEEKINQLKALIKKWTMEQI